MRKKIVTFAAAAALTVLSAAPAMAAGNGEMAQIHPGHIGYIQSGMANSGAAPVFHFHSPAGPLYEAGAGGWGDAVSTAASGSKGLKNAHGG